MPSRTHIVNFGHQSVPDFMLHPQEPVLHVGVAKAFREYDRSQSFYVGICRSQPPMLPVACTPLPACCAAGAGPKKVGWPPPNGP